MPNLVAVRRSCINGGGGIYTDRQTDTHKGTLQLYINSRLKQHVHIKYVWHKEARWTSVALDNNIDVLMFIGVDASLSVGACCIIYAHNYAYF